MYISVSFSICDQLISLKDKWMSKVLRNSKVKLMHYLVELWEYVIFFIFDTRHGVKKPCPIWNRVVTPMSNRCHVWHCFLTSYLASKRWYIFMLRTVAQLWHSRLTCNALFGRFMENTSSFSFFTPDMASKNYAQHGIGSSHQWSIDAMSGIAFDVMSGVKKSWYISML